MLSKIVYSSVPTWKEKFPNNKINLKDKSLYHNSWDTLFENLFKNPKFKNKIEDELSEEMEKDTNLIMHPQPDYVFYAFKLTSLQNLKVVILGQDPYFDHETFNNKNVSQAMGLSFSIPQCIKIPSSLKNIFANLLKFNHINNMPDHGNLESLANQGILLLNTSLTVKDGSNFKNCHQSNWNWFSDEIISFISNNVKNVIFVLWGSNALEKKNLIDEKKHEIIISSHPSGLSANKPLKSYPSFMSNDCFGKINLKLEEWNKTKINFNTF